MQFSLNFAEGGCPVNEEQRAIDRSHGAPAYNVPDAITGPGAPRLAASDPGQAGGRPRGWRWLLVVWLKTVPPAVVFAGLTIYLVSPQSPLEAFVRWIFGVDIPLRTEYYSGSIRTTSAEGLAQMLTVGSAAALAVLFAGVAIDAFLAFRKGPTSDSLSTTSVAGRSAAGLRHPLLPGHSSGKPRRTGSLLRSVVLARRRPIYRHTGQNSD
jgi:hypothetical protein